MKIDKVLVPLDGSSLAEMVLPTVIDLLRDSPDATLILLRAVEATTLPEIDPTEARVAVVVEAEAYLDGVAARLRDEGDPGLQRRCGTAKPPRRSWTPRACAVSI